MRPVLVETACTLRRLARRRTGAGALGLGAMLLAYAGAVRPVATAQGALSAASAVGAAVLLVISAGIVADDRERGRLALAATHPSPPAVWVVGRWLAAAGVASAAFAVAAAALLAVAGEARPVGGLALGAAASVLHLAALAALAVALSCGLGATAQVLLLLAVFALGAMPPDFVTAALGGAARAGARIAWAAVPTSWALGRLQAWSVAAGPPEPALALALVLQPVLWLGLGLRGLARAELARAG